MKELKISQIIEATKGECISGTPETIVTGVSTDSRALCRGTVFFALEGERFDGHDFLENAIEAGCSALVISKESGSVITHARNRGVAVVKVEDTLFALQELAAYYISLFHLYKIGVTGSTGKTTTKEMLYWILSEKYKTVRNLGNFNNQIGLPLSIFNIEENTEATIFEMGMDRLGEIHRLVEIVKPELGVITNIGLSHLERLGSQENIRKAKLEITDFFKKGDTLVVNWDSDMLSKASYESRYNLLTVGKSENTDLRIFDLKDFGEDGIGFTLSNGAEVKEFRLGTPGIHNATNAALAVAAALCFNITMEEAARGLAKLSFTDKRLHIVEKQGIKIIDDTYNASPDSMRAAIDVLVSVQGGRKIAILGDMYELGEKEEQYHFEVGEYASLVGVDVVISVGKNARHISLGARGGNTKAIHFETKELLKGVLTQWIRTRDVVLVKGSRGMAMDEIVKLLETTGE
jgi:UDP-N-acetylmuramoyl-tripeptide--D-alanyl-D-alanine ligase